MSMQDILLFNPASPNMLRRVTEKQLPLMRRLGYVKVTPARVGRCLIRLTRRRKTRITIRELAARANEWLLENDKFDLISQRRVRHAVHGHVDACLSPIFLDALAGAIGVERRCLYCEKRVDTCVSLYRVSLDWMPRDPQNECAYCTKEYDVLATSETMARTVVVDRLLFGPDGFKPLDLRQWDRVTITVTEVRGWQSGVLLQDVLIEVEEQKCLNGPSTTNTRNDGR